MKQSKRILVLSISEYRLLLYGLVDFRNKLIQQGRYPDPINELLVSKRSIITRPKLVMAGSRSGILPFIHFRICSRCRTAGCQGISFSSSS